MLQGHMETDWVTKTVITEIFSGLDYWPLVLSKKKKKKSAIWVLFGKWPPFVTKGTQRRHGRTSETEQRDDYEFTRCYNRCSGWLEIISSWESEWNPEILLNK